MFKNGTTEAYMKVSGSPIRLAARENLSMLMEMYMKVTGATIRPMDSECILTQTAQGTLKINRQI